MAVMSALLSVWLVVPLLVLQSDRLPTRHNRRRWSRVLQIILLNEVLDLGIRRFRVLGLANLYDSTPTVPSVGWEVPLPEWM